MTSRQVLAIVLTVALLAMAVQPSRAEALEPLTIVAIAGAGVVLLILVVYIAVASATESRHGPQAMPERGPVMVVLGPATIETP